MLKGYLYLGRCQEKWGQGNSVLAGRAFSFKLHFGTFDLCGSIAREKKKDKKVKSLATRSCGVF